MVNPPRHTKMPGSRSPHHDDFNRGRRTAALKYFSEGKQQPIRKEKTLQDILGNWFFEIKEFGQTPEREEKKMKRKLMTMLLALCLVVTMMPAMTSTAAAISSIEIYRGNHSGGGRNQRSQPDLHHTGQHLQRKD